MSRRRSSLAALTGTLVLLAVLLLAVSTASRSRTGVQLGTTTGAYWPFQAKITESTTEGSTLVSRETSLFAGAAWDEYVRVLLTVEAEQGPVSRSNWGSTLVVDGREVLHGWLQQGEQLTADLPTDSLPQLVSGFGTGSLNVTRDALPADAARQAPAALFTDFWTEAEAVDEARVPAAEASGEAADEARSVAGRLGLPLDDLFVISLPPRPEQQGFLIVLDAAPEVPVAAVIEHPAFGFTERLVVEEFEPISDGAFGSLHDPLATMVVPPEQFLPGTPPPLPEASDPPEVSIR